LRDMGLRATKVYSLSLKYAYSYSSLGF
jgi:hypothetical protein